MGRQRADTTAAAGTLQPPSLGRNVSFHLLWTSVFASGFGDRLAMLASLQMLGYGREGVNNASISAGIDFFFFLPYLLWCPLAGWLADRVPRRMMLFGADETRGVFVLVAWGLIPYTAGQIIAPQHTWMVWTFMLAIGFMAATMVPAKLSIVPNIAGFADLQRANAAVVCMGITGNLTGYIIGGQLLAGTPDHPPSLGPTIVTAALAYIVSGGFWLFVKTPWYRPARRHFERVTQVFTEIGDGLRYTAQHRPAKFLTLAASLMWTCTAVYVPAMHVINVDMYHGDIASLTTLMGCLGGGMLVGSIIMGVANTRFGAEIYITVGMIGAAIAMSAQMIVPNFHVGLVLALITGVSASCILVPLNTMLQRVAADRIRGRVFAAKEVLTDIGKVGGSLAIWLVGTDRDLPPISIALGVALFLAAIYGVRRFVLSAPFERPSQNLVWRLSRLYAHAMHRLDAFHRHRVPREGPVLIVANHTAGIDPILIQAVVPRVVRWMMVAHYHKWWLGWLWYVTDPILVHRDQRDSGAVRQAIGLLRENDIVGIFPEGGLNREREALMEFSPGVALIAKKGGAVIVPVYICDTPNTDSPLLSFLIPSRSRLVFGEPFKLDDSTDRQQMLDTIRDRIAALGAQFDPPADDAAAQVDALSDEKLLG